MDSEFVEVGTISRIQLSAAVILCIAVVIRNSLAAQVVVSAQNLARYFLRAVAIAAVAIRQPLILGYERLGKRTWRQHQRRQQAKAKHSSVHSSSLLSTDTVKK